MLTVVLVWRAGLRWGRGIALLAAFALAIQPQHVRESHFALTDVPLTCLVTLTLLLSLRASESGRTRAFAAAGLAAGAAAAIKYNGALALTMPLVAALAAPGVAAAAQAIGAALGAALLGFLAGAPYTFLDLPGFLNGFAVLMQSYNQPRPALDAARIYLQHIRNGFSVPGVLPLDLGWLAVSVSGLGMLAIAGAIRHRSTRVLALVTLVFPICHFWLISTQGSLLYGRYLLPMIPMGCIFLAAGMALIRDRLGRPGAPAAGSCRPCSRCSCCHRSPRASCSTSDTHVSEQPSKRATGFFRMSARTISLSSRWRRCACLPACERRRSPA